MAIEFFFSYVSTRSGADPVRTFFLCVPDEYARSYSSVRLFAEKSGWIEAVEKAGGLLVAPIVPSGWDGAAPKSLVDLYLRERNSFFAPSRSTIPGREGSVWTWEPLISVVGYEEGAQYAGNLLIAYPSFAACTVLVDGTAFDYGAENECSNHWFVSSPIAAPAKNKDVPVACWLVGEAAHDRRMIEYLRPEVGPAWRVRVSDDLTGHESDFASIAIDSFIDHVIRWKNSPDGTLAWHQTRKEFFTEDMYRHDSISINGNEYHFATYIPDNVDEKPALVFSVHGRGEPSWIFSDKNGWERLADKCHEFVVVLPDSPFNIWIAERDDAVLRLIIAKAVEKYGLDTSRVYLTGFSNGGAFTLQQASAYPELYAAASPWNWPPAAAIARSGMGDFLIKPDFDTSGFEMPTFAIYGDSDNKAPYDEESIDKLLSANGCNCNGQELDALEFYSPNRGFSEGERFSTTVFSNEDGSPRVAVTRMRDMPHGAIPDEARAAWEFMRRFRRPAGSKIVEEVQ